jgi:DNA-directed RNA polymerase subunit N (RpoN/RPB10)
MHPNVSPRNAAALGPLSDDHRILCFAGHTCRGSSRNSGFPDTYMRERLTIGSMEGLGRVERTDGDVVPVRISERKLLGSSAGIYVWLFFQPADESARPWQSYVKVVDQEEQEEAVSRLGVVGACQRRMLVGTPLVETEQYRSIRVEDLPSARRQASNSHCWRRTVLQRAALARPGAERLGHARRGLERNTLASWSRNNVRSGEMRAHGYLHCKRPNT